MPRAPRVEYAGAVYHVLSRGQRREAIVRDERDRQVFVETMAAACQRAGWRLHAWVLMTNHYHWLLETPEPNLVAGMQWFQTTYSTRYRLRHKLAGHVLQGRYKAILIQPDSAAHFEYVSSYIHLNPVRAKGLLGAEEPLEAYAWSSYPLYVCGPSRRPAYLVVERVLGNLTLPDSRFGRRRYAEHMAELCQAVRSGPGRRELDEEWKPLRRGWCMGSEEFRDQMLDRVEAMLARRSRGSYSGGALREHGERLARRGIAQGLAALGVAKSELAARKKTDACKRVLAWWVRTHTTVGNRWVANELHMGHEMNVSASVRLVREARGTQVARMRNRMAKVLSF